MSRIIFTFLFCCWPILYEKEYDILRIKNILVKSLEHVTDNIYFIILLLANDFKRVVTSQDPLALHV